MTKLLSILCMCALLGVMGCASNITINRTGKVIDSIDVKGKLEATIKANDEEITVNSKSEPIIKDLVNINPSKLK